MPRPVVRSTSPPRRNLVGSFSSETWAQRIGRPQPCPPATRCSARSSVASRSATVVGTEPPCTPIRTTAYPEDGREGTTRTGRRAESLGGGTRRAAGGSDAGGRGGRGRRHGPLDAARPDRVGGGRRGGGGRPRRRRGAGGGRLGGGALGQQRHRPGAGHGPRRRRRRRAAADVRARRRGLQLRRPGHQPAGDG